MWTSASEASTGPQKPLGSLTAASMDAKVSDLQTITSILRCAVFNPGSTILSVAIRPETAGTMDISTLEESIFVMISKPDLVCNGRLL